MACRHHASASISPTSDVVGSYIDTSKSTRGKLFNKIFICELSIKVLFRMYKFDIIFNDLMHYI